jgi:hypothetical protein
MRVRLLTTRAVFDRTRDPVGPRPLRLTLAAALAVVAAGAVGCGNTGSSNSATTALTGVAIGLSPHAEYAGFASAVNLRPEDAPGFLAEPHDRKRADVKNKAFEETAQYRHCFGGLKPGKPVFEARSDDFKSGAGLHTATASSTVEVARSVAAAQRDLAAVRSAIGNARARECLSKLFDTRGSEGRPIHVGAGTVTVTVGNLTLVPLSVDPAARGTAGGAGLSMRMDISYHVATPARTTTVPATLRLDSLAFVLGRAEVSLSAMTLGSAFPPAMEARLFAQLVSRARVASRFYRDVGS